MSDQARLPQILAAFIDRTIDHEGPDIEFKRAENRLPSSIWPTISTFANTNGGWIFLGVQESAGSFELMGVDNASAQLDHLHSSLRNQNKINYSVCGPNDVFSERLDDIELIIIRVPAAPRKERPVYIDGHPYEGTYIRRHSGDYRCRKQEVDRMMREASDSAADSAILSHLGWEDIDRDTLARYRRRYQTSRPESPWNNYDDQKFLEALRGYRKDRQTGGRRNNRCRTSPSWYAGSNSRVAIKASD